MSLHSSRYDMIAFHDEWDGGEDKRVSRDQVGIIIT